MTYLPVPGLPGYAAGTDGSVWSKKSGVWRRMAGGRAGRGRGVRKTVLFCHNGVPWLRYVHHVILETFVGPRPDGMECCHGPNGALDNRLDNLRWDTHLNNMKDIDGTGGNPGTRGSRNVNAKLQEEDIPLILRMLEERRGERGIRTKIARMFGVKRDRIVEIAEGISWNHVTGLPKKKSQKKQSQG